MARFGRQGALCVGLARLDWFGRQCKASIGPLGQAGLGSFRYGSFGFGRQGGLLHGWRGRVWQAVFGWFRLAGLAGVAGQVLIGSGMLRLGKAREARQARPGKAWPGMVG